MFANGRTTIGIEKCYQWDIAWGEGLDDDYGLFRCYVCESLYVMEDADATVIL